MSLVNYEKLKKEVIGTSVPKPLSGTLSGHAAGEPFDKHVYSQIKENFPDDTFRQYEYLNYLYSNNTDTVGFKARQTLFNSPTVMFLLSRGKDVTDKWSIANQFEEKQNDTADMLVVKDDFFDIIDIKTRNISKKAQAPNIISSYKLAQVCAKMIDNQEYDTFTINYFEIDWLLEDDKLVCKDAHIANLFKSEPNNLYINWASGMQIQFHVSDLEQSFAETMEEWAKAYLKHFVEQAKKRACKMIIKFVKPFEKYIK
jgi:type II restriction enzyme